MPESQKKCYGWRNKDGLNRDVWFLACAVNPGWTPNPVYGGNYSYPSDNGVNLAQNDYGGTPISITPLNSQSKIDAWLNGATAQGSCTCLVSSTFYCQGKRQAKVTISGKEYIFKETPIEVSCEGTILQVNNMVIAVTNCNSYKISCDDECPEGSHRCTHNKYPGYCCIPCKETGDRLKNMANKVGR